MTNTTELLRPLAWLCELMQEDGSTRTQIVTENPDGIRWNDSGEPSPFKVTPLYALAAIDAHLKQPSAPSGEPAPTRADLIAALRFYAAGSHRITVEESAWDTVSGEPNHWLGNEAGDMVEDGTIAAQVLAGELTADDIADDDDDDDGATPQAAPAPAPPSLELTTGGKVPGPWSPDEVARLDKAQAAPAPLPVATQDERPTRADFVRVARNFAFGYGLQDDAPSYLPRTSEARDVFEPHAWVIALAMQAYRDGKGDGRAQAAPAPQPSGGPATMDAHRLYLDLCDLCSEVNAADTMIGRPQLAAQKLIVMRDAVGRAVNGRLPYGAALSGELADIERLLGQFARACAFGDDTEARRAAGDAILRAFATAAAAPEPVGWAQLGLRNGHTYVRMHYEGHLYPPPSDVQRNLNLVPLYAAPQAAPAPQAAVQPLTEEQVVMDGLMRTPSARLESCASAFEEGARFAERSHGITATTAKE